MKAVLSNADHPEYGVATIPLPIPRNQYDHCVALLEALEIGDTSEADCRLDSLDSAWPVLNRLVCTKVNLDEQVCDLIMESVNGIPIQIGRRFIQDVEFRPHGIDRGKGQQLLFSARHGKDVPAPQPLQM